MVDPGPEAVKESPPWRAMRPCTRRLQCGGLSAAGSKRLLPSELAKVWKKKFWCPNPPNRGAETARREVAPIVQRQKGQAVSKATPCSIPEESWRTAAESRKYRCVVWSSSSHVLGGHGDKALTSIGMLHHGWGQEAKSLTSIRMLPHCKKEENKRGMVDPGPEAVKNHHLGAPCAPTPGGYTAGA